MKSWQEQRGTFKREDRTNKCPLCGARGEPGFHGFACITPQCVNFDGRPLVEADAVTEEELDFELFGPSGPPVGAYSGAVQGYGPHQPQFTGPWYNPANKSGALKLGQASGTLSWAKAMHAHGYRVEWANHNRTAWYQEDPFQAEANHRAGLRLNPQLDEWRIKP